jgi:hypothetical protein
MVRRLIDIECVSCWRSDGGHGMQNVVVDPPRVFEPTEVSPAARVKGPFVVEATRNSSLYRLEESTSNA